MSGGAPISWAPYLAEFLAEVAHEIKPEQQHHVRGEHSALQLKAEDVQLVPARRAEGAEVGFVRVVSVS